MARELRAGAIRLTPIPTYPDSVVYEGTADERSVIFKGVDVAGADPDGIALEVWSLESARREDVAVPRVLSVDLSGSLFPASFFVMEKVDGVPFDEIAESTADIKPVVVELGEALRRLHEVRLSGAGWLDEQLYRRTGEVRGIHESWPSALSAAVPDALDYLDGVLSRDQALTLREQVDVVISRLPEVDQPVLLHGDFGQTHVYVDRDVSRMMGIVDFGERSAGDWVWDLCEWETPSTLGSLLSGYGPPDEGFDLIRRLDEYVLIKAVPWAAKWHRRGELQVIDWLRSAVARHESGGSRFGVQ